MAFVREFKTAKEFDYWNTHELGGISQEDPPFDYEEVLECATVISDEEAEAFKKLSYEEQVKKDKEYQELMKTWSAEEVDRRWGAYFAKKKARLDA